MKNQIFRLCLAAIAIFAATGQAQRILWVSDCVTETAPHDQPYIDLLIAEGYTVERLAEPRVMDQAKCDLCNTYDLIIVGRHSDSGQFANDSTEVQLWNSITAPMINMNAYLWRSSRWKWVKSDATNDMSDLLQIDVPDHPMFKGVTPDENGRVNIIATGTISLCQQRDPGNGYLLGHRANTGSPQVWMVYWETGLEFYVGAGQSAGGPRLAFAASAGGSGTDGQYNLSEAGKTILLNAVYQMSGATFDRKPTVSANDLIAYANEAIQLSASIFDPEDAVTIAWSKVKGPGEVTFSDAAAASPTVSFTKKGQYVLKLEVTDTANVVTVEINAYVKDRADDKLIAHWDFDNLPDPNTLVDVTGNGFDGVWKTLVFGSEPNVVPGHISGSSTAAALGGTGYWEITNAYENDPNFDALAAGATIAAWVSISKTLDTLYPMIIGHGVNGWRLQVNDNRWNFIQSDSFDLFGTYPPIDGFWHHVVAVYDGVNAKVKLYVDGALNAEADTRPGLLLGRGTAYPHVQVGNRGDAQRVWPGLIDDIAVYNYALSDEAIAALAEAGDRQLYITAGPDQTIQFRGDPVQMDATLFVDDGIPAPAALTWAVVSVPLGADPTKVVFDNPHTEDPLVDFPPVAGTYVLRLTADDTTRQVADGVSVVLVVPTTCADVIAEGHGLATDLNEDCRVNLEDLALVAADWMRCVDPSDATCEWPY